MPSSRLKNLYGKLPQPVKKLAANAYGWHLYRHRYGPETQRLQAEARERETWTPDRLKQWQEERLAYILHRAATKVPYYRDQWAERRRKGDQASWEVLGNWPKLEKLQIQGNHFAFVAEDQNPAKMTKESTSGTSGSPLTLLRSERTARGWFAMLEGRILQWQGLSRKDRYAMWGGQPVVPFSQTKPPFWVWNGPMNQLYMSSYHLTPRFAKHYLDALVEYKIRYVSGYSSSFDSLALAIEEAGLEVPPLEVVFTNSEPLYDYQRENIQRVFKCNVFEAYGMTELVAGASNCSHGTLHTWPEMGYIEVVEDPTTAGPSGELVCTSLLDEDMPLIRYRTGDLGAFDSSGRACPCGRTLPALSMLDGRTEDLVWTAMGGRVCLPSWPPDVPLRESQVIQETLDRVTVLYIPQPDATERGLKGVTAFLQTFLGPVQVDLKQVDEIPRGSNGKIRPVICRVKPEEAQRASMGAIR